ncbi:methyl-accepting chemotaxis protein [Ferrimonas sp. YFM]|uniref:methyl-accepting chemotaxis protein n=1 Tax=Ferrimonas sp. YFM TaxID=3028878 RepID=UPI0025745A68|nr:methyl-accepting chemotaxis protein [Ferrimonas sp. YFM]BDY03070.1 chemotaxis protein [Ferrimonas sp. YFM]
MSTFNVQNKSIGFQLCSIITVLIVIAFSLTGYLVYRESYQTLLDKALSEHQSKVQALSITLKQSFDGYLKEAKVLETAFQNQYLDGLQPATSEVELKGRALQDLSVYGERVSDNRLVDAFTRDTGAVATVFVKEGSDYVRLSTSLTNLSGERVVGTELTRTSAAYRALSRGDSYYNKVTLFGKQYLTYYAPIEGADGRQIGASFVGLPVDQASQDLFDNLATIQWGDTGYSIVFDDSDTKRGMYIHHPLKENLTKNIIQLATEEKPFQKLFESDTGVVRYPHTYNGVTGEKYLVFAKVPGWNWVLSGGTFLDEVTKETRSLLTTIILVASLAGLFTIVVVTWVLQRILRPLGKASDYMVALGEGRVSIDIPQVCGDSRNEITRLTFAMGQMAKQLNQLVGEIKTTSNDSNAAARLVAEHAQSNLGQSEQQQQQVDQMATAIEEMASSANAVAEQVEAVAHNVQTANQDSNAGSVLVTDMEQEINSLSDQLNDSTDAIRQVHEESRNIESVTTMIDTIAEQTNLLALNAAIEAARAGEQGRGFAVVADEVRQLAHRTQSSVQEVVSIISQLQQRIESAVSMMNSSQNTSVSVKEKAQAAGGALHNITGQINAIADMAQSMATTSEQQAQVSQEIAANATSVSELNRMTRDTSAQTADSAAELQQLSDNLDKQVAYFS